MNAEDTAAGLCSIRNTRNEDSATAVPAPTEQKHSDSVSGSTWTAFLPEGWHPPVPWHPRLGKRLQCHLDISRACISQSCGTRAHGLQRDAAGSAVEAPKNATAEPNAELACPPSKKEIGSMSRCVSPGAPIKRHQKTMMR